MWKKNSVCRVGKRNREKGILCQDRVYYAEKDAIQVITLADGAGEDSFAGVGAERSCQVLGKLLADHYETLFVMEEPYVRFNIAANVKTELYSLCDRYGVRIEQLKSTLLGIAINNQTNTFIAVHLGDGRIDVCSKGKKRTISCPENGGNRRQTYLTSMKDMGKHLRILKGDIQEIRAFILQSDGWQEEEGKRGEENENGMLTARAISGRENHEEYTDDVSRISLQRRGR